MYVGISQLLSHLMLRFAISPFCDRRTSSRLVDRPSADQARTPRDGNGLRASLRVELAEDVRDVCAGRLLADEQGVGDLAICPSDGEQFKHLAFARRQSGGRSKIAAS